MDNSVAKVTLEKSRVHSNCIKSKISDFFIIIREQRKVNKCRTKSGKLYIDLCIVVKYINGKQVIYLHRNI